MRRFNFKAKYRNVKQACNLGHIHDSKGEAHYCNTLQLMQKVDEIKSFEIQKPFVFMVNNQKICTHKVDFFVTKTEGKKEVHEFKGFKTAVWKLKHKLFKALFPEIEYRIIE